MMPSLDGSTLVAAGCSAAAAPEAAPREAAAHAVAHQVPVREPADRAGQRGGDAAIAGQLAGRDVPPAARRTGKAGCATDCRKPVSGSSQAHDESMACLQGALNFAWLFATRCRCDLKQTVRLPCGDVGTLLVPVAHVDHTRTLSRGLHLLLDQGRRARRGSR